MQLVSEFNLPPSAILCFSWNTDRIPLCDKYYEKAYNKINHCYNPLFFQYIHNRIKEYNPMILVFVTEGDLESGTWFHSNFLPYIMDYLDYRLLVKDKFSDWESTIRMSIYVKSDDETTYIIDLKRKLLLNDNTYNCSSTPGVGLPKLLTLYISTLYGNFAFIGVQIHHAYANKNTCIKSIDNKFIKNEEIDYVFLLGDFANNYLIEEEQFNDFLLIDKARKSGIPPTYLEGDALPLELYPNYNLNLYKGSKEYSYSANDHNTINNGHYIISWHDRIFYKNNNKRKENLLSCILYETIKGFPMLKIEQSRHLGVLGVFLISSNPIDHHNEELLFSKTAG